ncbi:MAG: hypothetical protein N2513_09555, partial [Deltaproteobacteria bacterium]|nr:hypothetical protein [Deltaproteobacteria bacterium]
MNRTSFKSQRKIVLYCPQFFSYLPSFHQALLKRLMPIYRVHYMKLMADGNFSLSVPKKYLERKD